MYEVLKLKPKIRRIMWSRRAQEYDAKKWENIKDKFQNHFSEKPGN